MKHMLYKAMVFCLLVSPVSDSYAFASPNNEREPFEKMFFEYGYKSVDDAVSTCEKHFNRDIELPVKLPPVGFTHAFGRCNFNNDSPINDHLEIEYLSDHRIITAANHYVINIRPLANKIKGLIHKDQVIKIYELEDGAEATYGTLFHGKVSALIFERSGWQYWLWVDKRIEEKVSGDTLFEIANSIGLGSKYKEKPFK